ncbi:MAG: galactitol-1-phosphate 5-dehydrogenase [Lachnospiraceae bacterium]|nr:galactitol-1-phosphate 5-dehydrogenase [Lachnospiraceae bacterium]
MKAWVLHGVNDIRLETVETPSPGRGEVLVAVKAAGVCGSDIPRIYQTGAHVHPLIPGHEFAGVVETVGEGVEKGWKGKRVGAFPLIPCKTCRPCRGGQYEMCRNYGYVGSRRHGGFAQYVAVPVENLIEIPPTVTYEAAAMLEPMAVAVHAMRRARGSGSGVVAVCGLGAIGLLLLMFLLDRGKGQAQPLGRKILVVGNKGFQRQAATSMGLPEACFCDSRTQAVGPWLQGQTGGEGVDLFFECVGKEETAAQAIDNGAPGGQVILVGNPYSDMRWKKEVYWKILRNQLAITGTWNSSFNHGREDDWHYALDRLAQKKARPEKLISHRFPLEGLGQGLRMMRDKTEDYGKVMLRIGGC